MYVVSGKLRGRKILVPHNIRPTMAKVRDAIFKISSKFLPEDFLIADLFCGSGAMSIEALSRGAKLAYMVDKSQPSLQIAKKNAEALNISKSM